MTMMLRSRRMEWIHPSSGTPREPGEAGAPRARVRHRSPGAIKKLNRNDFATRASSKGIVHRHRRVSRVPAPQAPMDSSCEALKGGPG
jgi:hypothetical protein